MKLFGRCQVRGSDPLCEAAKSAQNEIFYVNKIQCESIKSSERLECETRIAQCSIANEYARSCVDNKSSGSADYGRNSRNAAAAYSLLISQSRGESEPFSRADAQDNLSATMIMIGDNYSDGAAYEQAVELSTQSLLINTRENRPSSWSSAMYHLADALGKLGKINSNSETIQRSVGIFRELLSSQSALLTELEKDAIHKIIDNLRIELAKLDHPK